MHGLLCCPVCGGPLDLGEKVRQCARGHCYDRAAKGGYVHLLRQNRRGAAVPGDSPEMCRMRTRFLSGGWYAPLRAQVAELAAALSPLAALDAGCGEGYYTAAVFQACRGKSGFRMAGVDLAKAALRHAGRACPEAELAAASLFDLPVATGSLDLITHLFAPLAEREFARALRPGGALLMVTPGARHLWGLKQALYDAPYENDTAIRQLPGFTHVRRAEISGEITLTSPEDIEALYRMTPYAWKTSRAAAERLLRLPRLPTETAFLIDLYDRN